MSRAAVAFGLILMVLFTVRPAVAQTIADPTNPGTRCLFVLGEIRCSTEPDTASPSAGQTPVDPATDPNTMGIRSYGSVPLSWYEVGCDPDGKDPSILGQFNPVTQAKRGFTSWANGLKCDNMNIAAQGGWIVLGFGINAMQFVLELPVVDWFGGEIDSLSERLNAPLVTTPFGTDVTLVWVLWLTVGIAFAWSWLRGNASRSWMHLGVAFGLTVLAGIIATNPSGVYDGTVGSIKAGVQTIYATSATSADPNVDPGETLAGKLYTGLIDPMWEGVNFGRLPDECRQYKPELLRQWGNNDAPRWLLEKAGCHEAAKYQASPTTWRMFQSWGIFWTCLIIGGLLLLLAGAFLFSLIWLAAIVAMGVASCTLGIAPPFRRLPVASVKAYATVVLLAFAGAIGVVVTGTFVAAVAIKANESNLPFAVRFMAMPATALIGVPMIGGARHVVKRRAHVGAQRILGERPTQYKPTPVLSRYTNSMREVPGLDHAVALGEKAGPITKTLALAAGATVVGAGVGTIVAVGKGAKETASAAVRNARVAGTMVDDATTRAAAGAQSRRHARATPTRRETSPKPTPLPPGAGAPVEIPAAEIVDEAPARNTARPEPVPIEPLGWEVEDIAAILERTRRELDLRPAAARRRIDQRPDDWESE